MSTRSADSRDHSPDAPDGSAEKRASKKRKVLSCYACRNRKMKCDRVYPVCGRCQKTGRAAQCTYDPRLLEESSITGDIRRDGRGIDADDTYENAASGAANTSSALFNAHTQDRRLDVVEQILAIIQDAKGFTSTHPGPPGPEIGEVIMFRGKGLNTHFYGSTSPYSLITQFTELQSFTREALRHDSSIVRIRTDFKTFRTRRKVLMEEKRSRIQGSDEEIIHSVPPKSEVDAALVLYWEQVEHTYHILHEPSFWAEYSLFWQPSQPQQPKSATFAAILVLIVAITKCLSPEQEIVFVGDRSAQRESAAELIDLCDMWLLLHTRKHLTLAFFQLQCLSLLAKRANSIKMKQAWVHSGEVMRLAIATGMHRNPSFKASQKISEFDKEMRRRLWGNIVELEVQSSIDSGLPSSMCGLHCDVQDPSNISDDLLSSTSTSTPSPLPLEKFTRTSYLAWSSQSLQLRVQLMQRLNSPTNSLHYSDVLAYDAQISSLLSSLPNWDQPQAIVPSALLRLQLRQFSLMLHRPYARLAASNASFGYSFTTCVDAANSIASLHDDLRNRGLFFLNHLRADAFRTSMTLAQIIYHVSIAKELSSAPLQTNATDVMANDAPSSDTHDIQKAKEAGEAKALLQIPALPQNDFLMATLCSTSISILENIHSTFEDKTLRLGTAYMEFWLMTAAMGIMPSTSPIVSTVSTSDSTGSLDLIGRGRKAVDRFTSLCFRVLALQKDPGTEFASSLRTTIASASNTPEMQSVATPGGRVTPIMTGSGGHMGQAFMANPEGTSQMLDEAEKGILDNEMDFGMQAMWGDVTQNLPGWDFNEFWMFDSGGSY